MTTRLDEYDQLEWWDVARQVNPRMTWEQFEADWAEFTRVKARRGGLERKRQGVVPWRYRRSIEDVPQTSTAPAPDSGRDQDNDQDHNTPEVGEASPS
jgi:hypothetical protein